MTDLPTALGAEPISAAPVAAKSSGVFVSHVHEDKPLADAFVQLIRDVTAGSVDAYSSSDNSGGAGIRYGHEWFDWIKERVDRADHVVALLTPTSVGRPWILFEAGLGSAKDGGTVFGLALGLGVGDASSGPFGVFHNSGADRESLIKLCKQLISASHVNPRDQVVGMMVDQFLESVRVHFEDSEAPVVPVDDPKTAALFQGIEDLKFLLRERESEPRSRKSTRRDERDLFMLMEGFESDEKMAPGLRTTMVAAQR